MNQPPGFVGKIPSQGDFVSRRLPWDFIECWDTWLQEGMGDAREALGQHWLNTYLVAPVWRFLLSPGVCGASGWLGVWFPSVDRVGRHFPLSVCVPIAPARAHPALLFSQEAWLSQIEEAALQALDPRVSLEQLDAALLRLPLEENAVAQAESVPPGAGPALAAPCVYTLPDGLHGAALGQIASTLVRPPRQAASYWHTWGTEQIAASYLVCERLPGRSLFPACLSGSWAHCGLTPQTLNADGPESY